jgi:pimeloyl-ACP methyl ester carboxylesterase
MDKKPKNLSSDLQGISQVSIDAVKGTTKVVESLHSTISQYTTILGDPNEKTKGITGLIYKTINSVTYLLGEGINKVLNKTSQLHGNYTGDHKLSATREAVASAMNGVLGDHFENGENPLAINMSFRVKGISLDKKQLLELFENATNSTNTVTIVIHGLCMNDLQWTRENHNHGESLAEDLGHTIVYLHYNSGLHISKNGRQLSQLLNSINYKNDLSIKILAHSMGGLVARSACYYAQQENHNWLTDLDSMVFLGTPHHGAPLAKGGHWIDILLEISPYSAPFAKITRVRSNGLTDLRHGYIVDEDWLNPDQRKMIALPENVHCFCIATTKSKKESSKISEHIVGDGLVSVNSALGKHDNLDLDIPKTNQWIGRNIDHMQLLSDKSVYNFVKKWMA